MKDRFWLHLGSQFKRIKLFDAEFRRSGPKNPTVFFSIYVQGR